MDGEENHISKAYSELKSINANNFIYKRMNIEMDKIKINWLIDEKNNIIWHNSGTSKFNSYIAFHKNKNIGIVLGNIFPIRKVHMTVIDIKLMNYATRYLLDE